MTESFDFIVRGARIIDGSGRAAFVADVGLRGDRIARIGSLDGAKATREIDAGGRVLAPGFIDVHLHTDLLILSDPDQEPCIRQGVTTQVLGQDGISYSPASPATQRYFREYFGAINGNPTLSKSWTTVAQYLDAVDGAALNAAYLLPHGTIRCEVMGHEDRAATPAEIARMQALVEEGMADGAVGLSTGLEYLPGAYGSTDELVAVCEPVGRAGGIYVTHQRSYFPDRVEAAFWETCEIGKRARLPVHVSHYNGKADQLGPLADEARRRGFDLTYETYPYMAGCTILAKDGLPGWVQEGGRSETLRRLADPAIRQKLEAWFAKPNYPWDAFQISNAPEDRDLEGLRLVEAARRRNQKIGDFICDLLIRNRFEVASIVHVAWRTEDDVVRLIKRPEHMAGSDGIYTGTRPHPRGYGCFARYLELAISGIMPMEEMIQHLSSRAARRFRLGRRGHIREGWMADLVLFDPARVRARANYENGAQFADGIDWVFVNGRPALADGQMTGERPGRGLRRSSPADDHAPAH